MQTFKWKKKENQILCLKHAGQLNLIHRPALCALFRGRENTSFKNIYKRNEAIGSQENRLERGFISVFIASNLKQVFAQTIRENRSRQWESPLLVGLLRQIAPR